MKVTALIPAHNEADSIAATIAAVKTIEDVNTILVIDDASSDDTARIAEDTGARVIRLAHNVGKGAALEYAAKRCEDAEIVLLLDGDLGESAEQAGKLLDPVLAGEADMTIARFPRPTGKAGFGLVKNMAREAIAREGSFDAQAPLSGQRAITRTCLDAIRPFLSGYGVEVGLTIRALRKGYRLLEVETTMTHAATGRDLKGFIHRGKQYIHVRSALRQIRREK